MYRGVTPLPDRGFIKTLKTFDDKLNVVFDRAIERFVICRERAYGKPFGVRVVETEDGQFRQPDQRDIRVLFYGDLWRHGGVKERTIRGEQQAKAAFEKEEADQTDDFKALTRENKIQLSNAYRKAFNEGSKAPEFRRVNVKGPGLTLKEIQAARAAGRDPWADRKVA